MYSQADFPSATPSGRGYTALDAQRRRTNHNIPRCHGMAAMTLRSQKTRSSGILGLRGETGAAMRCGVIPRFAFPR